MLFGRLCWQGMINGNPQLRAMVDSNPQMRAALSNPDMMRQMMEPENIQAMLRMQQVTPDSSIESHHHTVFLQRFR